MSDHQEPLHEELEQIRVALDQMASEARGDSRHAPSTDRSIQITVEIQARAVTVERLFMVSERRGWTLGETLDYALDALELTIAKTSIG